MRRSPTSLEKHLEIELGPLRGELDYAEIRRVRRQRDNQAYALGLAVERAIASDWSRSDAFVGWLPRQLRGVDLEIAKRGIVTVEPLTERTLHARRYRWGRVVRAMISLGEMPEAAELVRQYLDGRHQGWALAAISEALSPRSASSVEPFQTPPSPDPRLVAQPGVSTGASTESGESTLKES